MKLKLKLVAVAAALASLAGGAQADLTIPSDQNGSFSLLAVNTVTLDWYIRDLGYTINSFLPTGITTSVADNNQGSNPGPNPAAVGDKTPASGLLIDGSVKSNFSDPSFATWLGTQNAADVKWMVGSYDNPTNSTTGSQRRLIVSSPSPSENFTNANLDTLTSSGLWGGLNGFFGTATLSNTGTAFNAAVNNVGNAFGSGAAALVGVGSSANLFYAVRSTFTGSTTASAVVTPYGNAAGLATVTLEADGDFIYNLEPATVAPVPLPPALWMMGAGLMAIGGMVRRRRAAALQA